MGDQERVQPGSPSGSSAAYSTLTLTLFVAAVTALFTNGVFVSYKHAEPPVVEFKYDFEHFGDPVARHIG